MAGPSRSFKEKRFKENGKEEKTIIEKVLGDVSKSSAAKQVLIGTSSGWLTGFLAVRIGKTVALLMGGGIILLQIAYEKGYIKIDWKKVNGKIDQIAEKVEEQITGESDSWSDKVEKYVDKHLDLAEKSLKKEQKKAKKWYAKILGKTDREFTENQIFVISYVAGVLLGIGTA